MVVIANQLLRGNKYGILLRVSTGAVLSIIDAVSDVYILSKYYSQGLTMQANVLLVMVSANLFCQVIVVLGQYKKKSLGEQLKELLITLFFLRPAIDAFRVSTNHTDSETTVDPLKEMMINKVRTSYSTQLDAHAYHHSALDVS